MIFLDIIIETIHNADIKKNYNHKWKGWQLDLIIIKLIFHKGFSICLCKVMESVNKNHRCDKGLNNFCFVFENGPYKPRAYAVPSGYHEFKILTITLQLQLTALKNNVL